MNALRGAAGLVMFALIVAVKSQTPVVRPYWPTPIDSLAAGRTKHTHIAVRGLVTYTRIEDDGDLHIRLQSTSGTGAVIVAECIPKLPCRRPRVGDTVTVRGISRRDAEHGWYEVHPVEELSP